MTTTTIREQIAAELKTTIAAIGGVTVRRAPQTEFDESELPALGLYFGDQQPEDGPVGVAAYRMAVQVSGHATGASGEAADTAANALYGAVQAAVMADYTRNNLAVDTIETGLTVVLNTAAEGEIPLAGFELIFEVVFWTRYGDPTALAP